MKNDDTKTKSLSVDDYPTWKGIPCRCGLCGQAMDAAVYLAEHDHPEFHKDE